MKKDYYIVGLLGVAAILVIYYLMRQSQQQPGTVQVSPDGPSVPNYPPNPAPIQLGDITIGQTPAQQSYNVPVDGTDFSGVQVGTPLSDCGCQVNDCEQVGTCRTVQQVSPDVLKAATDNVNSFLSKDKPITSGVEAARVTFSAA